MSSIAVLFDSLVTVHAPILQEALRTPWEFRVVADRRDVEGAAHALRDADAFIGNEFSAPMGREATKLRLLHCSGAGVDLFDLKAIPRGAALCNVYEHEIPMAEYILMVMLLFATRVEGYHASFRQGRWDGSARSGGGFHEEVHGKTLGLIGFGHIGSAVAARAKAFGMRVIAVRQHAAPDPLLDWCGATADLPRLLGESDFVAVVCPHTPQTQGLLGERELRMLKPTARLINVSRAAIIDEDALYRALAERWFAGAALDVWYQYPASADAVMHGSKHPFHELPNVIVTPHLSAWTHDTIERRYRLIARNLDRLARGEPLERVVYQA